MIEEIEGGISVVKGVKAGGIFCGIKEGEKKDLAAILFPYPCKCVALFTKNYIKSASIEVAKNYLKKTYFKQVIIITSGCAITGLGTAEKLKVYRITKEIAKLLKIPPYYVLPASTGEIGIPLPLEPIIAGLKKLLFTLRDDIKGTEEAAEAITTTDSYTKLGAIKLYLPQNKEVRIGGIGKGAGMIFPSFATTLLFFATNVAIPYLTFKRIIKEAAEETFNRISVDACRSPNDTLYFLTTATIPLEKKDYPLLKEGILYLFSKFAKSIVADGEGASARIIEVRVKAKQGENIARSVANNLLVKVSCAGNRLSVGRILAAIGATEGIRINLKKLRVKLNNELVIEKGQIIKPFQLLPLNFEHNKEVIIEILIDNKEKEVVYRSAALAPKYLEINMT